MTRGEPLWKCPACGHRFVLANLWHSCGNYPLEDHFARKDPNVRRVFDAIVGVARDCGPVTVYAQKTRIVLQHRVRFASVVTRKRWLILGLWLKRRVEHPALTGYEPIGTAGYYPKFQLCEPSDIDGKLRGLLGEAYGVGSTISRHP